MNIAESILANIRNSRKKPADNEEFNEWDKDFLRSLEWKRFEKICMEYLQIKNCNANVTCTGADGGIDIKITDPNDKVIAIGQCKSWNKPIGVSLIRELYGVMAAENVKHGIFLTTSSYSNDARNFAEGKNLVLIDAEELVRLVNSMDEERRNQLDRIARSGDYKTPTCVKCNIKMVKKKASKGKNAGQEFWGCRNYPKCKITMKVRV